MTNNNNDLIESAKRKTMVEVKSKKPLLEAIQNGEQFIKITDPKFLLACLVAEECENDK